MKNLFDIAYKTLLHFLSENSQMYNYKYYIKMVDNNFHSKN